MSTILRTKLFIPRRRPGAIPRPRLVACLNAEAGHRLTLISAPAGSGKTSLLAEWISTSEQCVTWLSLDAGDNDPARFWGGFLAALQTLLPDLGQTAQGLLESPQAPPLESVLAVVINDIAERPVRLVHVFDDYHFIENPAIDASLTFLLEHCPSNLHIILASRSDPALPLARWRGGGQMAEVRAADLRFTPDEAAAFLNGQLRLGLSAPQLEGLATRTEGWAAGLHLLGLSIQGHPDKAAFVAAFTGSHRFIVDYLVEEVLRQQPDDLLAFLRQTAILEALSGPLCEAVTGRKDSQAVIEHLERVNLFLIPLDDEGHWYRYHHLFADALRHRQRQTHPAEAPALHRRAAAWFAENGMLHEAIQHALAGQDYAQAARWIERIHGDKWQSGEIQTLDRWLQAMPLEVWSAYPRLWLVKAWASMTVGEFEAADADLRAAEAAVERLDEASARLSRPEVAAFRASHASLVQDPRAVELAEAALRELPGDYWMRGMLVVFLGASHYVRGELAAASQVIEQARDEVRSLPVARPHQLHLLAFGSQLELAKGNLNRARALLNQALAAAEPAGKPLLYVGTLLTYMTAGMVLFERGELDQAQAVLERCRDMAMRFGSAEVQVYALSYLSRIALARDDAPAAADLDAQVAELLSAHQFSPSILAYVNYHRFLLLLSQGNLTAAGAWVEAHAEAPGPLNAYAFHRLALPQYLLAAGSPEEAQAELARLVEEAAGTGHNCLLIRALVLRVAALEALGRGSQAWQSLDRALGLAAPEGFTRAFFDAGPALGTLLRTWRMARTAPGAASTASPSLIAFADRLLAGWPMPATAAQAAATPAAAGPLIEPLREREQEVLRLIAQGYSNQEIAAKLVVGVSTVKTHINHLFQKLSVSSRTQAIARGRELGLLDG